MCVTAYTWLYYGDVPNLTTGGILAVTAVAVIALVLALVALLRPGARWSGACALLALATSVAWAPAYLALWA